MAKRDDSDAKRAELWEWDAWSQQHPDEAKILSDMLFFQYFEKVRAERESLHVPKQASPPRRH